VEVSKAVIDMEMVHDHPTGYWNLSSMAITLVGKMSANCSTDGCDVNLKNTMNVAPKKGFTSKAVDINCQRDYTMCTYIKIYTLYSQFM
jgi:hypothetical protein